MHCAKLFCFFFKHIFSHSIVQDSNLGILLAQLVKYPTFDLKVMSLRPLLGVEIT